VIVNFYYRSALASMVTIAGQIGWTGQVFTTTVSRLPTHTTHLAWTIITDQSFVEPDGRICICV